MEHGTPTNDLSGTWNFGYFAFYYCDIKRNRFVCSLYMVKSLSSKDMKGKSL